MQLRCLVSYSSYIPFPFMIRALLLFFITSYCTHSLAQQEAPLFKHGLAIEYSYVPGIFLYGNFLPDNIEYSYALSRKINLQAGLFSQNADEIPGDSYFDGGFAIYSGAAMKFLLFRNNGFLSGSVYFTPSMHLYADYYAENNSLYDWTFTVGPTIAAEYVFSDRISCRLDLVNFNIGMGVPYGDFVGTVHRLLGLGVQYRFAGR